MSTVGISSERSWAHVNLASTYSSVTAARSVFLHFEQSSNGDVYIRWTFPGKSVCFMCIIAARFADGLMTGCPATLIGWVTVQRNCDTERPLLAYSTGMVWNNFRLKPVTQWGQSRLLRGLGLRVLYKEEIRLGPECETQALLCVWRM